MDWQIVAFALAAVAAALLGALWVLGVSVIQRVVETLQDVALTVNGHGVRLDHLERDQMQGRGNGR